MCDLLGMSFNTPINARFSLDIFQLRGEANPDGWGLVYYRDERLQVIKEATAAITSTLFDFIENYPQSKTFISHVRRSTRGAPSYLNTHPFYRHVGATSAKVEYAFAHNGTLKDLTNLQLESLTPLGETDSEHAFCYILDAITTREIIHWDQTDFKFLEDLLRNINSSTNTFNCIFSNGSYLFCYSDENRHNDGLRFIKHSKAIGPVEMVADDFKLGTIEIESANIGGLNEIDQTGYVIVTRALTSDGWVEFDPGELIVFRDGAIVYPQNRTHS
ncbi:MAG: class II glutamine amidotransferase [Candidatus Thorarchaeota archaeon]|jgi:glutamine amidotransferase